MTNPAPTQKRTRKPLTAERFVAKMRYLDKTGMERMLAVQAKAANAAGERFLQREARIRCDLLTLVSEDERPAAVKMTNALGIRIDREPPHPPPNDEGDSAPEDDGTYYASDDVPAMPAHEIDEALSGSECLECSRTDGTHRDTCPALLDAQERARTGPGETSEGPPDPDLAILTEHRAEIVKDLTSGLPRGARDYTPGPAAAAARKR